MRAGDSATGGRSLSDPVAAAKQESASHVSTLVPASGLLATTLPDRGMSLPVARRAPLASPGRVPSNRSAAEPATLADEPDRAARPNMCRPARPRCQW